jgi:hypothetical protein
MLNDTVAYPDTFYKGRDPAESSRHFVDLEIWNQSRPETGTLPFAVEAFGKHMSEAIRDGDWNRVLLDAGRLAHYISDICQPYHSTVNYDPATKNGTRLHVMLDSAIVNHLSEIRLISSIGSPSTVNFTDYSFFLARQSHSFLAEINTTLIDQDLPWSPRLTAIIENRTNTAIIATINVWHTAISASKANAPELPETKTLSIVASSTIQQIDVSHDNTFEFTVVDSFGVRTPCEIRTEVAGIILETESYRDLANPWINYRVPLPANKLKNLSGTIELSVTALRGGYALARLLLPLTIDQSAVESKPAPQPNYMIYMSIAAGAVMLLSSILMLREYRKQRQRS